MAEVLLKATLLSQIQATHKCDERILEEVENLLCLIEDILDHPFQDDDNAKDEQLRKEEKTRKRQVTSMLEEHNYTIDSIGYEIANKISSRENSDIITLDILNLLSNYEWNAKLVLVLAAFAFNYGESWDLVFLSEKRTGTNKLSPQLDALKHLVKAMLDLTWCIARIKKPSSREMSDISIHATYWIIKSVVACASQITSFTDMGFGYEISEEEEEKEELSGLGCLAEELVKLQCEFYETMRKVPDEAYKDFLRMYDVNSIGILGVINSFFYKENNQLPLVHGATKRKVKLDVLEEKHVLLLISDLDISQEELSILEKIYLQDQESRPYEVVWLPILDPKTRWNTLDKQKKFKSLQEAMKWYSVQHPSLIETNVIKFIKEKWDFQKEPVVVPLDKKGQVLSPSNALHLMWIWGNKAFPFTEEMEEELWKKATWCLEFLVDDIDKVILKWIAEGRHICLYGGEDIKWIRKFTKTAHCVAEEAGIALGMVYVGKSNRNHSVRRNTATVAVEKLSHYWSDSTSIWHFWVRLKSMMRSKDKLRKTVENDQIMREISTMLSYDNSKYGWALFAKGSTEMVGFLPALRDHLKRLSVPDYQISELPITEPDNLSSELQVKQLSEPYRQPYQIVLPVNGATAPEGRHCDKCSRPMEMRFIIYECSSCTDE
ncbi:hypothetical protein Pint_02860 [Pistacia integerrima]|uniref:Uncharacterized protein n=1 Tax=Pistacia integerrima TaxID=434235 RepID=A0ACC0ZHX2_9ROSI|nr:hypothetical protein Pint_02860 [Pistacia integerrima]